MSEPGTENPKPVLGSLRFENTRFDPDLTPFHELAKDMATQFGYAAELSGDRVLLQLLRLRVAQLNPCSYCLILHAEVAARCRHRAEFDLTQLGKRITHDPFFINFLFEVPMTAAFFV